MDNRRRWAGAFLLLFFCSGATALVYEVVWSKFLAQMFGSTVYAQTVVLAVFMGGLALGNYLFGRKSDTTPSPMRTYGYIELTIGVYACLFPSLYAAADRVFVLAGSQLLEHSLLLLFLKGALAVALLLGPTLLMGGTLPLLAAWLQRNCADAGRRSARFYAVNSLGAVAGAGFAGFFLVRNLGMIATLQMTALANAIIGATALLLASRTASVPEPTLKRAPEVVFTASATTLRWAALLVAVAGGASMGLEVLASRSLALIFGSSLQAFAIMLMAFILGIGLGSVAISSFRAQRWQSERVLVWLLLAAAFWIGLLIFRVESLVDLYRVARSGLARSTAGHTYHQLVTGAISLVVLGVPAALIGSVLPLLIRAVAGEQANLGEKVGRLLTWNTLGAVAGVLLTGFVLMPAAGLRNAFGILAIGLAGVALAVALLWRWRVGTVTALTLLVLLLGVLWAGDETWRHVMSSGVFRAHETEVHRDALALRKRHILIDFYEDSPDATVSVEHGDGLGSAPDVSLRINGKTDASSQGDLATQLLVGHLPLLARPEARDVFILGLGSGITAGAVLGHAVTNLTIAENCAPVIRAARFFDAWNRGVLTNPVARVWQEDARTVLKLSPRKYDVIITQPSNPWMAGVGSVFSQEYYELAASRLKDGGIVAQWFQLYDMHDGIVSLVLRTFATVFPHMEIWDTTAGDIVLLGSRQPWPSSAATLEVAWQRPAVRADFKSIGIQSPAALLARQLASQRTAFAIPGEGPIQTDWFPVLEYEAPRAFYLGQTSRMLGEFDERTWQVWHTPAAKRQALEDLEDDALKQTFGAHGTVNPDLYNHLRQHFRRHRPPAGDTFASNPNLSPCVFRLKAGSPAQPELPASADEDTRALVEACSLLEPTSSRIPEGVARIEALLRRRRPEAQWAPAYYAGLAVKASLGEGQLANAKKVLNLGLQFSPADPQLHYLQRVIERTELSGESRMSAAQGADLRP